MSDGAWSACLFVNVPCKSGRTDREPARAYSFAPKKPLESIIFTGMDNFNAQPEGCARQRQIGQYPDHLRSMAAKDYGIGEELVLTMNRHTLQGVVANDMTAKENADKGATYHLPDLHGKRQGDAAFFLITLGTRLHTTERRSSHWSTEPFCSSTPSNTN